MNNVEINDVSGYYFSGDDFKTFIIYEINNDQITKYSFIDSLAYPNYTTVKESVFVENNNLILKANNEKLNLTRLNFNELDSLDALYSGSWYAEKNRVEYRKRFFKKSSMSYEYTKDMNTSYKPLFYSTNIVGPYFNRFYFIRERGLRGGFYLINNLSGNNLKLFEISRNFTDSISLSNVKDTLDLKGDWVFEKVANLKVSDSLFKKFTIDDKGFGKLKSGAFIDRDIFLFPNHDHTSVFLIINDSTLTRNILEFKVVNMNPFKIVNDQIIQDKEIFFVKE